MEPHTATTSAPARVSLAKLRTRWAAVGAAIAVTLGGGGLGIVQATTSSGERAIYQPIEPCRLADVRPVPFTVGPRTSPLGPAETYTLDGWGAVGDCNLPTGTTGLSLNVTAVGPTAETFLRLWPADAAQPTTSNLNPAPGSPPTPNAVNVGLSPTGEFSIFNNRGNVSVIVDVVGVYDDHNHDDRYYTKAQVDALITGAKPTVASAQGNLSRSLTSATEAYATLTTTAPAAGTMVVTVAGYVYQSTVDSVIARCSITQGNAIEFAYLLWMKMDGGVESSDQFAGTRTYPVAAGQNFTVKLVCNEELGSAVLADANLVAVFIPD